MTKQPFSAEKLLVFVKAPRPGAVKTRLAQTIGAVPACLAYRRIVATLLNNLQKFDAVELCFTPDNAMAEIQPWLKKGWQAAPQGDGDLGLRLHSAFERAFIAGAQRVLAIGSDCPMVTAGFLREAWAGLRSHDVVLGPASDGGYWVIGLRQVHADLFHEIPWSTENVFGESLKRIHRAGLSICVLRELSDVDTERDWLTFLAAQNQYGKKA